MQIIVESSSEKMKRKYILTTTNHTLTFQHGILCKIAASTISMGSLCGFWIALPTAKSKFLTIRTNELHFTGFIKNPWAM